MSPENVKTPSDYLMVDGKMYEVEEVWGDRHWESEDGTEAFTVIVRAVDK